MEIKLMNCTNYANIYGLFENGKVIGTKEVGLAGIDCKTYYDTWSKYSKKEIKKFFKELKNK